MRTQSLAQVKKYYEVKSVEDYRIKAEQLQENDNLVMCEGCHKFFDREYNGVYLTSFEFNNKTCSGWACDDCYLLYFPIYSIDIEFGLPVSLEISKKNLELVSEKLETLGYTLYSKITNQSNPKMSQYLFVQPEYYGC